MHMRCLASDHPGCQGEHHIACLLSNAAASVISAHCIVSMPDTIALMCRVAQLRTHAMRFHSAMPIKWRLSL